MLKGLTNVVMAEIFISYRRDDVPGQVGRLYGRLADHYGEDCVFMDVESLVLGQRFEQVILERIKEAKVMLVVMGPGWHAERPHTDDQPDLFQLEVETALAANTTISALLMDRTTVPETKALPEKFREVFNRQAFPIRQDAFNRDVNALIEGLEKTGVKPSARHKRRRVEAGLAAGGWPYSWLAALSRTLTPLGVAFVALTIVAGATWRVVDQTRQQAFEAGKSEATEAQEIERQRRNELDLQLAGRVTDGANNSVGGAQVSFLNQRSQQRGESTTDSKGVYTFDLFTIGVNPGDRILVEISKTGYRQVQELVRFEDGFREFRTTVLKGR